MEKKHVQTFHTVEAMIIGPKAENRFNRHVFNRHLNHYRIGIQNIPIKPFEPPKHSNKRTASRLSSVTSKFHDSQYPEKNNALKKSETNTNLDQETPDGFPTKANIDRNKLGILRHLQSQQKTSSLNLPTSFDFDISVNIADSSEPPHEPITKNTISQSSDDGLSKFHRRLLATTSSRQRFVVGSYPLYVSIRDSPTRKWLGNSSRRRSTTIFAPFDDGTGQRLWEQKQLLKQQQVTASSQVYVNGTTVERSLASFERYAWLMDGDDRGVSNMESLSLELVAEIHMKKPAYLNILPKQLNSVKKNEHDSNDKNGLTSWFLQLQQQRQKEETQFYKQSLEKNDDMLWVTDFSLTKPGGITSVDTHSGIIRPIGQTKGILGGLGRAISNKDGEHVNNESKISFGWPNEVGPVPAQKFSSEHEEIESMSIDAVHSDRIQHKPFQNQENALLVTDGFLVPGRENGGIYVVKNLGQDNFEWKVCLTGGDRVSDKYADIATGEDSEWFYHRAVWVDLTGDGRKSILTARAKRPSILNMNAADTTSTKTDMSSENEQTIGEKGQLVWLECPKPYRFDDETGTPLDVDDTVFDPFSARHLPWKLRVLDEGPDVMFSVADLNTSDESIEVIASQFFGKCVSLHSIQLGNKHNDYMPQVIFRRVLDDSCGSSFSSILAKLEDTGCEDERLQRVVVDNGSTIETLEPGDTFSHLLVTSHESSFSTSGGSEIDHIDKSKVSSVDVSTDEGTSNPNSQNDQISETLGGSLFAYSVPKNWKVDTWERNVIATGFGVRGQLGNMINPGAPGFCYTFYPKKKKLQDKFVRPYIAVSGDCAEAAYIFQPYDGDSDNKVCCVRLAGCNLTTQNDDKPKLKNNQETTYNLMCEIECGATVGSLAIGYDNFCGAEGQKDDYAKIYVPCFEKDKVLVFSFGNGEEEEIPFEIESFDV